MTEKALEIIGLCKTYEGDVTALSNLSFSVDKGDFFALLGPNGAGKSTTIGIIMSLVRKTAGQVKVFSNDIETHMLEAKRMLGLVPQEFNFNIFEKVLATVMAQAGYYGVPRHIARERAEYYLKKVGLWDKRNVTAQNLSGGMKRRLMIARALVHEPKLLILDEPTAGVDVELRHFMWEFLRELNEKGTTIILTTHYLEEAEALCRNIAIINDGQVVINTNKRTLLDKLHKETLLLTCARAWETLPHIENFTIEAIDPTTLSVQVPKSESLNKLFQHLSQVNIEVTSVRNKTNPLEELFLMLTTSGER